MKIDYIDSWGSVFFAQSTHFDWPKMTRNFVSFFFLNKNRFHLSKNFSLFFLYIDRIEFVQLRFISIEMSLFLSLYPSLFSTIHSTDAS